MPRELWKGANTFGLAHVPVGLYSAETRDELNLTMLVLGTPYLGAFRVAFYLIFLMFIIVVVCALGNHPFEGYDPTPNHPR